MVDVIFHFQIDDSNGDVIVDPIIKNMLRILSIVEHGGGEFPKKYVTKEGHSVNISIHSGVKQSLEDAYYKELSEYEA